MAANPAEAEIRARAAAEERAAILDIVESAMRHLAHGHGANAGQILQHVADEIRRRETPPG